MRKRDLHGLWEVSCHEFTDKSTDYKDQCDITSARFQIDKNGDISWYPHQHKNNLPYMQTEHYSLHCSQMNWYVTMYLQNGQSLKFQVKLQKDKMTLNFSDCFKLHCKKIGGGVESQSSFSLFEALRNEEFADLNILAKNGKSFKCHKCILSCVIPEVNWDLENNPLSCKNPDVIDTILHFVYSGCLPVDLTAERARKVLKFINKTHIPMMQEQVEEYLDASKVNAEIVSIIEEVDSCVEIICRSIETAFPSNAQAANIFDEPGKFSCLSKEVARELCVASARVLLFCDVYTKKKKSLTQDSKNGIFTRISEMVIFCAKRMIQTESKIKESHSSASPGYAKDLWHYMYPEVSKTVKIVLKCLSDFEVVMNGMVKDAEKKDSKERKERKRKKLRWKWKNFARIGELVQLKIVQEEFARFLEYVIKTNEKLTYTDESERQILITSILDELQTMVPYLEKILQNLVNNGGKKRSKTFMKIGANIFAWFIENVRMQKRSLQPLITTLSSMVSSESFDFTLERLGLSSSSKHHMTQGDNDVKVSHEVTDETSHCKPAAASTADSLAKCVQDLLKTKLFTDMEFYVSDGKADMTDERTTKVFQVHRVIVSTRCEWFRRALQSGMKESFERKFHIEDCSPMIFEHFLDYLYGATIDDFRNLSEDNLADLLIIADRYETDGLVPICETLLSEKLDDKNVFLILGLSDSLGANTLKDNALGYIEDHIDSISDVEDFSRLSDQLKDKVTSIIHCKRSDLIDENTLASADMIWSRRPAQNTLSSSDSSDEESRDESCGRSISSTSSDESLNCGFVDNALMMSCIESMREVLGADASESDLRTALILADFNINRAINFYFQQQ